VAPPKTDRQRILDELNRLRKASIPPKPEDVVVSAERTAVEAYEGKKVSAVVLRDPLTRPLDINDVNQLVQEVVNEVIRTSTFSMPRNVVTRLVEQRLLSTDRPIDLDVLFADFPKRFIPAEMADMESMADIDLAVRVVTNDKNEMLRTFPSAPTKALKLKSYVEANRAWGYLPKNVAAAILTPNAAGVTPRDLEDARKFLDKADVNSLFATALEDAQRYSPVGKDANPRNPTGALYSAIGTFSEEDLRRGDTSIPNTFMPPPEPEIRGVGFDKMVSNATPTTEGAPLTDKQFTRLVDDALRQQKNPDGTPKYPLSVQGTDAYKNAVAEMEEILRNFALVGKDGEPFESDEAFAEALVKKAQEEASYFDATIANQTDMIADKEAATLAKEGITAAQLTSAISSASGGLYTSSDINTERQRALRQKMMAGEDITPDDVREAVKGTIQDKITADIEAKQTKIQDDESAGIEATENAIYRLSRQDGLGLLSKSDLSEQDFNDAVETFVNTGTLDIGLLRQQAQIFAQAEVDKEAIAKGKTDIAENEVLRALEKADYGNVGDLGEYQKYLEQFLPEIIDNLETIRRRDPTATLDVVSLLKEEILPNIEGLQTQDEFEAELLRKQSPLSALRIRQDLNKEADLLRDKFASGEDLTEEEKGLLGVRGQLDEAVLPESPFAPISPRPDMRPDIPADDFDFLDPEQAPTDILPPGVPGLPGLDVGTIEQSELKRRQDLALHRSIVPPAEGELEDIAFAASGGDPWFQQFLLSNLDPEAISKAGEEEAKKRRQAAWDKAIKLQDTPNLLGEGMVLTPEEAARFADRPLAPVQFEPLVQEQIPELKKQFEQSPAEVSRRQREEKQRLQDIEDEEERARREREQKQQQSLRRRGRTVFTGLNL